MDPHLTPGLSASSICCATRLGHVYGLAAGLVGPGAGARRSRGIRTHASPSWPRTRQTHRPQPHHVRRRLFLAKPSRPSSSFPRRCRLVLRGRRTHLPALAQHRSATPSLPLGLLNPTTPPLAWQIALTPATSNHGGRSRDATPVEPVGSVPSPCNTLILLLYLPCGWWCFP
jgi:hypothetical protein